MALQQIISEKTVDFLRAMLVFMVLFTSFSVIHENRHKATAEGWGCEAEIDYLPSIEDNYLMATSIDCPVGEMSNQEIMLHRMEQRQIESVGYQVGFLLGPLSIIVFWVLQQRSWQEIRGERTDRMQRLKKNQR